MIREANSKSNNPFSWVSDQTFESLEYVDKGDPDNPYFVQKGETLEVELQAIPHTWPLLPFISAAVEGFPFFGKVIPGERFIVFEPVFQPRLIGEWLGFDSRKVQIEHTFGADDLVRETWNADAVGLDYFKDCDVLFVYGWLNNQIDDTKEGHEVLHRLSRQHDIAIVYLTDRTNPLLNVDRRGVLTFRRPTRKLIWGQRSAFNASLTRSTRVDS